MKKSFLLIAMLLLFGSSMFAQDFDLGVKIGYQTEKLSYKQADIKSSFQNHLTFGLFGRFELGALYIQPEIMYFKTGDVFSLDATNISGGLLPGEHVTFTLNESQLQVPILIGVRFVDFGVATIRAHVGPTANFTVGSQTLFDKDFTLTGNDGETVDIEEGAPVFDTKKISWGMQVGVGTDILGKLTLDINYNFGLSKIFGSLNNTTLGNYFDFTNVDTAKQSKFMVTVGYKFL